MGDPLQILAAAVPGAITASSAEVEAWHLAQPFIIARGAKQTVQLLLVTVSAGGLCGRGESCPTEHYGETAEGAVAAAIRALAQLEAGTPWAALHERLPPGAARNAIDCALWDLACKASGQRLHALLGRPAPTPVETVYTLSLESPEAMAAAARRAQGFATLKLKLGAPGDAERLAAVRAAVPQTRLIADVNEHWDAATLAAMAAPLAAAGIAMLEQPLPAGADDALAQWPRPVPVGADESCHVAADLPGLTERYDLVNIKLDKTGGLTEALRLMDRARGLGLKPMVGCMLGTSLAMAPAHCLAQDCVFVDLDAPLLIGADRTPALRYRQGWIDPPDPALWG